MIPLSKNGPDAADIETFLRDGLLRLDAAVDADLARACRDHLWAQMGLSPDRPEGWTKPVIQIAWASAPPFVAAANTPRLHAAYDALAGPGRWLAPNGLGSFPIRFPHPTAPGDDGWHVDMSFGLDAPDFLEWRVNVTSRGRALLMLFLLSDTGAADAPTRIRKGSHRIIARELLPHGAEGLSLRELASDGFASTAGCEEALATGPAGTVYLCHPFLVHAAQAHRGTAPRFLAQPALLPSGPFDPHLPPSPVQLAIRQACGL